MASQNMGTIDGRDAQLYIVKFATQSDGNYNCQD